MKIAITLLGLALWVFPLSASNDVIRACSDNQQRQITEAMDDFELMEKMNTFGETFDTSDVDTWPAAFHIIDDLQVGWWEEFVPSLPNCSLANEMALIGGRVWAEYSISLAVANGLIGESSIDQELLTVTKYHLGQVQDLADQMVDLIEELG